MDESSQSTVLFADVAGSTALYERIGDARALARIGDCLTRLRGVTGKLGGRAIKSIGDGLMCAFPDASAAARAGTDMQLLETGQTDALALRIGFHSGAAIEREGDLFGDTVNVASRVVELAKPWQILTTGASVLALPGFMRSGTRRLGGLSVRGKTQAVDVYEILWHWSGELTMVDTGQADTCAAARAPRLALTYRGRRYEFAPGEAPPSITIGRGEDNDIVVAAPRASRLHGRIEVRQSRFVFVDQSTNGSFVRVDGGEELQLRREALPLHGCGIIGLGHSATGAPADALEFRCE